MIYGIYVPKSETERSRNLFLTKCLSWHAFLWFLSVRLINILQFSFIIISIIILLALFTESSMLMQQYKCNNERRKSDKNWLNLHSTHYTKMSTRIWKHRTNLFIWLYILMKRQCEWQMDFGILSSSCYKD